MSVKICGFKQTTAEKQSAQGLSTFAERTFTKDMRAFDLHEGMFRCPFPMRIDSYYGCDLFCKYCFAWGCREGKGYGTMIAPINIQSFAKNIHRIMSNPNSQSIVDTMVCRRVPMTLGTISDPFHAAEAKIGASQAMLGILASYDYPLTIATKGRALVDDPKILKQVLDYPRAFVRITLIGLDEHKVRALEPVAPTPKERLELFRTINKAGKRTMARLQPFTPGITDVCLEDLLKAIADTGAFGVTLESLKYPIRSSLIQKWPTSELGELPLAKYRKYYVYEFERYEEQLNKAEALCKQLGLAFGADMYNLHRYSAHTGNSCCGGIEKVLGWPEVWMGTNFTVFGKAEYLGGGYYRLHHEDVESSDMFAKHYKIQELRLVFDSVKYLRGFAANTISLRDLYKNYYWNITSREFNSLMNDGKTFVVVKDGLPILDQAGYYVLITNTNAPMWKPGEAKLVEVDSLPFSEEQRQSLYKAKRKAVSKNTKACPQVELGGL